MAAQTTDAWAETRKIQKEFSGFYKIAGGLLLVFIGVMIGAALFHNDEGYWGNILSEVLGIGFAVFVLDQRAEQRAERRQIKELQERLVMESHSTSNEAAKRAVDELRHRGWLEGENGLLKRARLWEAKLQGADLREANLRGTEFSNANLQETKLMGADLRGANLCGANLQGADLYGACLYGAALDERTNLQAVSLEASDLYGTILMGNPKCDESTKLPDGTYWTPDTNLLYFTDPNRPINWQSNYPYSLSGT